MLFWCCVATLPYGCNVMVLRCYTPFAISTTHCYAARNGALQLGQTEKLERNGILQLGYNRKGQKWTVTIRLKKESGKIWSRD